MKLKKTDAVFTQHTRFFSLFVLWNFLAYTRCYIVLPFAFTGQKRFSAFS